MEKKYAIIKNELLATGAFTSSKNMSPITAMFSGGWGLNGLEAPGTGAYL